MQIARTLSAFVARRLGRRGVALGLLQSAGIGVLMFVIAQLVLRQVEASFDLLCVPPPDPHAYDSMRGSVLCDPEAFTLFGLIDVFAVGAIGLGLLLVVPAMVTVAVAGERKHGTLEQLRTAPLSPLALVLGFVLGGPARVYLWLVVPMLLHVAYGLGGGLTPFAMVASLAPLVVGSFALSLLGVLAALGTRRASAGALPGLVMAGLVGSAGLLGLAVVSNIERHPIGWAFAHPGAASLAALIGEDSVWRHLFVSHWRIERLNDLRITGALELQGLLSVGFFALLAGLLLVATTRRLARPELPVLGKRLALGLFVLLAVAVIGPAMRFESMWYLRHNAARYTLVYGFFLLPIAALLIVLATPSRELWMASLGRRTSLFADGRSALPMTLAMIASFASLVLVQHHGFDFYDRVHESIAVVWGLGLVLTLPVLWQYHVVQKERSGGYLFLLGVYLVVEVIGIALCGLGDGTRPDTHPIAAVFARTAAALAIGLPLAVGLLQRRQRRLALATPPLSS